MKIIKSLFIVLAIAGILSSCAEDNDDQFASDTIVNNFIYRGMNTFYLYKPDIEVLADDRFETIAALESFHSQFDSPEAFFESLIFERNRTDRFSVIVDDFVALEQALSGNTLNNGMEFGLVANNANATDVYGYVRFVQPNSNAESQGVQRGFIFNQIDGIQMTRTNFRTLLAQNVYTIGLATFNNGDPVSNGESILLTKSQLQENPILLSTVIEVGTARVGYLAYNSFLRQFDEDLNSVFADFRAQNITNLVLDLRYNGGGSVNSAIILGSLITGTNDTDVYLTEEWNPDIQQVFLENNPEDLVRTFTNTTSSGSALNRLNLSKVHVITTSSTASASELIINSLAPYIDVVQVGDDTTGKFTASITIYDSDDFGRAGANPAHNYAMQPQVFKSINANGNTDFIDGLTPDIPLREDFGNLGILGDPSEPLLSACLNDIAVNGSIFRPSNASSQAESLEFTGSSAMKPLGNEMWVEDVTIPNL